MTVTGVVSLLPQQTQRQACVLATTEKAVVAGRTCKSAGVEREDQRVEVTGLCANNHYFEEPHDVQWSTGLLCGSRLEICADIRES